MKFRQDSEPVTAEQMAIRKRVYEQITAAPSTFDMGDWERSRVGTTCDLLVSVPPDHECTTTRCLGGWAQFFKRGYVDDRIVEQDAINAMGLSRDEFYRTDRGLFLLSDEDAVEQMKILAGA